MELAAQLVAFPQLAQEVAQPLLRYLQRYVGDEAVADDLLQETLIRIARGLPDFAGRASAKTWAFSIATHVAADYFRRPERRLRIVAVEEAESAANSDASIDEQLVVDEMQACVRQVIDLMPEDYRAALVLHDLEGLSTPEIAEICGCSLATAKIRIHPAWLRLKQALKHTCEFYRDSENVFRCDRKP